MNQSGWLSIANLGQGGDEVVYVGHLGHSHNLVHGHLSRVVTICDVFTNAAIEEDRLL